MMGTYRINNTILDSLFSNHSHDELNSLLTGQHSLKILRHHQTLSTDQIPQGNNSTSLDHLSSNITQHCIDTLFHKLHRYTVNVMYAQCILCCQCRDGGATMDAVYGEDFEVCFDAGTTGRIRTGYYENPGLLGGIGFQHYRFRSVR